MEEKFRPYLLHCEQDINDISPHFQAMNEAIKNQYIGAKAAKIKVLLLEGDGILTDGSVYYNASGQAFKKFNYQDRTGVLRLLQKGITILLINPEEDPIIKFAAQEFQLNTDYSNFDKASVANMLCQKEGLCCEAIACLCNNQSDLLSMPRLGLSLALKDSTLELKNQVDYVLDINGGQGVIQAIADLLINQ